MPARRFTLDTPCPSYKRREKARHDSFFPLEQFRCSRFRPITDYPLDLRDFRAATCSACHTCRRDGYLEQKGQPVSQEGRARRFKQAQRTVEKALQARIRAEKRKARWLDVREQWEQGELTEGWRVTRGDIESFRKGKEYREGLYRQWAGYTDPRESSTGVGEGSTGPQEESWKGLTDGGESFTDPQDGWGGYTASQEGPTSVDESWEEVTGVGDGWDSLQKAKEGYESSPGLADGEVSLQADQEESSRVSMGPQESRESSISLQDQYYSSCTQKKPLTDFGRFFTCTSCRQKNKRIKEARQAKYKTTYVAPKATQAQIEYSLQAWSKRSEFKLLLNTRTRPLTIEDYLNKNSRKYKFPHAYTLH